MQLIFGVIAAARWISIPHYIETLNPNWMIPCVGNLVVAFAAPIVDTDYTEVGWLWYGFGVVTFVPLFVLTIYRVTFKEFMGESSQHTTTTTQQPQHQAPAISPNHSYTTSPPPIHITSIHSHDTNITPPHPIPHHTTPHHTTPHHTTPHTSIKTHYVV